MLCIVDHLFIVLNRNSLSNILSYLRYQRVFQKKSSRWSVTTCKEPKQYSYVTEMMRKIILKRLDDAIGMNQKMVLEQDDPRRVSSHLAPIPPPPTQQIVHEQRSRFRTSVDMDKTIDYWVEWTHCGLLCSCYLYDRHTFYMSMISYEACFHVLKLIFNW